MLGCGSEAGEGRGQAACVSRETGAEALVGMCGVGQQGLLVLGDLFAW